MVSTPAKPAAGDDERQHPLADGGLGLEARHLQNRKYAGAEQCGVAKGLQRHRVFGHALQPEKVRLRTQGEHEVIIVEVQRNWAQVAGAVHPLRGQDQSTARRLGQTAPA